MPLGQLTEHSRGDKTLVIDAERPAWLALDHAEAELLRRLRSRPTVRAALDGLDAADRESLLGVVGRLVRAGFLAEPPDLAKLDRYRQVQIHLTNRCNLTCTHCYMDSAVRITPETELDRWRRLLDELAARYSPIHVSFSGGEPMLSASLIPLLEHVKSLQGSTILTAMITNGLLLRGARLARVAPLLDVCAISLDGISPETHDLVRGRNAFRRTYRNLQGLADTPFRKVLNITVLRSNRDELVADLRPFLAGLPFRTDVDLGTLVPEGRGAEVFDLGLPQDEFRETLAAISASLTGGTAGEPSSVGVDGSALWTGVPVRPRQSCGYGDTLTIYSNGDVSTCLTPRFIRGNVFADGAEGLIDRIDQERELLQVNKMAECRVCDLRHVCGGRCHLGQLRGDGRLGQVACSNRYKESFYDNLIAWSSSG
ncbi:radical SAM/SPASM domain-containing protein [Actinophytocola oryzae]|uniref:radical SAM/SPASM domain-containing protein n=1 Tax=Actinophytocola oryzae TaxID=502181 RepID=UPI001063C6AD|nr:radical SAM protein [Actinophytocola oryzae]